ncbi:MAG: hypothetical protein JXR36_15050 [Bacteroidales bacterium]|nr:hypothetical protein [Bacteroidales bacterium]
MRKNVFIFVLIFITGCQLFLPPTTYITISNEYLPVFESGDIVVFKSNKGDYDTFMYQYYTKSYIEEFIQNLLLHGKQLM